MTSVMKSLNLKIISFRQNWKNQFMILTVTFENSKTNIKLITGEINMLAVYCNL